MDLLDPQRRVKRSHGPWSAGLIGSDSEFGWFGPLIRRSVKFRVKLRKWTCLPTDFDVKPDFFSANLKIGLFQFPLVLENFRGTLMAVFN